MYSFSCRNAHNGLIYCGYLLPAALCCLVYNYMMQCVVKPSGGGLIRFRTPGASCYPPVHVPDLAATYSFPSQQGSVDCDCGVH